MEEVKFNENDINEVDEVMMSQEDSNDSGIGKLVFGIGVLAVAGIGALVYKNREKIEKMRIAKLEKKGYVIYRPEEVEQELASDEETEDEE